MAAQTITGIGPREIDILRLLWLYGPATVRELHKRPDLRHLAYTTVLTVCVRLAEKGVLDRQRADPSDESRSANAYIYTPRFNEAELRSSAIDKTEIINASVIGSADRASLLAYLGTLRDPAG